MAWLTFQLDDRAVKHQLDKDDITIGRSRICEICLEHDPEASRLHCSIHRKDGESFVVVDTVSKNGTFVNGERISHEEVPLRDGDKVRVGRIVFTFHAPAASPTTLALDEIAKEMQEGKGYQDIMSEILAKKKPKPAK